jgi:hypothetical protein
MATVVVLCPSHGGIGPRITSVLTLVAVRMCAVQTQRKLRTKHASLEDHDA